MTWWKPKTIEEQTAKFWEVVEKGKEDILNLCSSYHPAYRSKKKLPISATAAEVICEQARQEIAENYDADPREEMRKAFETKNVEKLQKLCSDIWFGMPESMSVREEIGFSLLCDICSDAPVSDEQGDEATENERQ